MERKQPRNAGANQELRIRELTPRRWGDLETLFGPRGACGGCWCMYWRLERGERYEDIKGAPARRRFRELVAQGRVHGVIAYARGEPVGWCSFERRVDLPRLDRAPSLAVTDAARVWSLPCFFIKAGWRGQGVASALLTAAIDAARKRGAEILEGYPTQPSRPGKLPAAWAWTGVPAMFEAAGFSPADARMRGKLRYRRSCSRPRAALTGGDRRRPRT